MQLDFCVVHFLVSIKSLVKVDFSCIVGEFCFHVLRVYLAGVSGCCVGDRWH